MKPVKVEKLWNKVYKILLDEISNMSSNHNRLSSEEELAKDMGISRATVREAMQQLIGEGYITRRHGKGNFTHPSAVQLSKRIDLTVDFVDLLSKDSKNVSCRCIYAEKKEASDKMKAVFPKVYQKVYTQHWMYSADDKPLILCKIEVPVDMLIIEPEPPTNKFELVKWLEKYCGLDIAYYATRMCCKTDTDATKVLELPKNTYMQNWQETVYDIYDNPVAFSDLYFHPEDMDLSMVLRF